MAIAELVDFLGGRRAFPVLSPAPARRRATRSAPAPSQHIVSFRAVETLSRHLGVPPVSMLELIGIADRTALRRKEQGRLNADESDRLLRIARVAKRAAEVLGSMEKARAWLTRDNPVLGGVKPLSLLATDPGAEQVSDELGRIEYGDFA